MLDEVENVYRCEYNDRKDWVNRLHTLECLTAMANCTSGHFAVLLCSSSTSLPYLVSTEALQMPGIRHRYQLSAIDLNSNKFRAFTVESPPPTHLGELSSLLQQSGVQGDAKKLAAAVTFFVGHNAQAVSHFMNIARELRADTDSSNRTIEHRHVEPLLSHLLRPSEERVASVVNATTTYGALFDSLLDAMYEANRDLFTPFTTSDTACLTEVTAASWKDFKPISGQRALELVLCQLTENSGGAVDPSRSLMCCTT